MWRADCSRVTHPFAARVPRRALPLDLHVLSTPPAFVLSQDQTLQQKLALTKNSPPRTGPWTTKSHIKTGTTPPVPNKQARHTVEFSKDTRTPSRSDKPRSGAVFPADPTVHPAQPEVHRGVLRGPVSGPGDRSPRGSFCPASRLHEQRYALVS